MATTAGRCPAGNILFRFFVIDRSRSLESLSPLGDLSRSNVSLTGLAPRDRRLFRIVHPACAVNRASSFRPCALEFHEYSRTRSLVMLPRSRVSSVLYGVLYAEHVRFLFSICYLIRHFVQGGSGHLLINSEIYVRVYILFPLSVVCFFRKHSFFFICRIPKGFVFPVNK